MKVIWPHKYRGAQVRFMLPGYPPVFVLLTSHHHTGQASLEPAVHSHVLQPMELLISSMAGAFIDMVSLIFN